MSTAADYLQRGFESLANAHREKEALARRERELSRPLPDVVQNYYNPPPSTQGSGIAGGYTPEASAEFDRGLASLLSGEQPQAGGSGVADTSEWVNRLRNDPMLDPKKLAQEFRSRVQRVSPAVSQRSGSLTQRDLPALEHLDSARRNQLALRREEEISRRVLAGLDKKGEQAGEANDTKKEVARIKAEADRDRAAVSAHARIRAAELALEGALARAKQMGIAVAGKNDPRLLRLKGLQLQLKAAEEKLQSATRGYTSDVSFVDEGERAKNDALVKQATAEIAGVQQQIQAVNEELGSGATSNGQAPFQMKVPPGSPPPPGMEGANVIEPPAPQGAVGPPPRLPMGGAVNPGAPAGFTGNEARNPKQHGIYGPDGKLLAPAQAAPPLPTGAAVLDQSGINTAAQVGKTKKVGTKTFVWNGQEWIREGSR